MDYKKLVNPLSKITLSVLIVCLIYGIVKLYEGEGDIMNVIGLICIIISLYVIPKLWSQKPKP